MTVPEDQGKSLQGWRRVWKTCPGRIYICSVSFSLTFLFLSGFLPFSPVSLFCLIIHISPPSTFFYFCLSPPLSLLEMAAFYLVLIFWVLCEVLFMYPLIILDELNNSISILHGRKLRHRSSNFSKLSRYSQGFELHLTNPQTDFPELLQSLSPHFHHSLVFSLFLILLFPLLSLPSLWHSPHPGLCMCADDPEGAEHCARAQKGS